MPAYKGFFPMGPTDVKPWGQGDLDHEKNVVDCLVMDTIGQTKNLTGHKHRALYDGYGYQTVTSDDTTKTIKMGALGGDHKVELQLGYGSPEFNIKRLNGTSAFKWEDSLTKATIGGALDVNGSMFVTGNVFTEDWTNITSQCIVDGVSSTANMWVLSRRVGAQITVAFRVEGVSNQTYFNVQLPFNIVNLGFDSQYIALLCPIRVINNSLQKSSPGYAWAHDNYLTFSVNWQHVPGGDWTIGGSKGALGMITFTGAPV